MIPLKFIRFHYSQEAALRAVLQDAEWVARTDSSNISRRDREARLVRVKGLRKTLDDQTGNLK